MRKPISRDEAERILVNGGEVWRGKIRYRIPPHDPFAPGKLRQEYNGGSVTIAWKELDGMGQFEVEEDASRAEKPAKKTWSAEGDLVEWETHLNGIRFEFRNMNTATPGTLPMGSVRLTLEGEEC